MKIKNRILNKAWIWIIPAVSFVITLLLTMFVSWQTGAFGDIESAKSDISAIPQLFFSICVDFTSIWLVVAFLFSLVEAFIKICAAGFMLHSWRAAGFPILLGCIFAVGFLTISQIRSHERHQRDLDRRAAESHGEQYRITNLPAEIRVLFGEPNSFQSINSAKSLPAAVTSLFLDSVDGIAEPDEEFQVTDVIGFVKLPFKRLIWAAKRNDFYVVHYEQGGFGYSCHLLIAKIENGHGTIVWHGPGACLENFGLLQRAKE